MSRPARRLRRGALAAFALGILVASAACSGDDGDDSTIRVGLLHTTTGKGSVDGAAAEQATLAAVAQVNGNGGVLGRQLEPIVLDAGDDAFAAARLADRLINEDDVAVVFGGSAANLRALTPVFERFGSLLLLPATHEGLEVRPNVVYGGAIPNQRSIPAVAHAVELGAERIALVGEDTTGSRRHHLIMRDYIASTDAVLAGEILLRDDEAPTRVELDELDADVLVSTLPRESSSALFDVVGPRDAELPVGEGPPLVVSLALGDGDVTAMTAASGHLVAGMYFDTIEGPSADEFRDAFSATAPASAADAASITSEHAEAAFTNVLLWTSAVEQSGAADAAEVVDRIVGVRVDAPGGGATITEDHHVARLARLGQVTPNGSVEEIWISERPILPDPYLALSTWWRG